MRSGTWGTRFRVRWPGARAVLGVVAAVLVGGALMVAAPATAGAAPSTGDAAGAPVAATDIGTASASGCTGRNGPGDVNQSCVHVYGTGTHVRQIRGAMQSYNWVPTPITLCGVKVHVWGTYANGARFDHTGTAACTFAGSAFVNWYPDAHFRDGTSICARTQFKNQWSNPACIQIRR